MTDQPISYQGPMSEDDYLALVLHVQEAMAVEPFKPSLVDVVKLLSDWRTLTSQVERQRAALIEIENWVGKTYRDLAEAESIRDFIDKACEKGLGPR